MKQIIILLIVVLMFPIKAVAQAPDADKFPSIILKITGLKHTDGKILASIFNSQETYLKDEYKHISVPITNVEDVTIIFDNIPAGLYAASVLHDENNNGEMDTGWMKIPIEPYGFSNNSKASFGPPSFKKTKFKVIDSDVTKIIELK